jgi:hypothetical protein
MLCRPIAVSLAARDGDHASEIRDARARVSQQLECVEEVRSRLQEHAANLETRRQALVQRRQEWIEAAE